MGEEFLALPKRYLLKRFNEFRGVPGGFLGRNATLGRLGGNGHVGLLPEAGFGWADQPMQLIVTSLPEKQPICNL